MMVVYGPWIDDTEHLERIIIAPEFTDVIGDVRSGIVIDEQDTRASVVLTVGGAAGSLPEIDPSIDAWAATLDAPLVSVDDAFTSPEVHHTGSHNLLDPFDDQWFQVDTWRWTARLWDIWQAANPTPPEMPDGAFDIDWDGPQAPPTIISMELRQNGSEIPQWGWVLTPEGHVGFDFGPGNTPDELMHSAWPGWSGEGPGYEWDSTELATIQSRLTATSTGRLSRSNTKWPALALGWVGGYPGHDPNDTPAHGPFELEYTATPTIELRVTFTRQRHRFVYSEIPIRRTSARHDSRAGGAGRNWPQGKSFHSSNRTSGGEV